MHEDAIATVREEEGHGFILAVSLRPLRVGDGEVYLLPHLIQRGERLAAAIDALTWGQRQHGIDATRVVRAALDKRERQQLHLARIIVDTVARLRQHLALRVLDDDTPRILLNLNRAVVCAEGNRTTILCCGGFVIRHFRLKPVAEHHIVSIVVFRHNRCRQHPDTGCPRRDKLYLDLQVWVVVIRRIGKVEHLHPYRPIAIQVKRLTRRHPVALPLHQSLPFCRVETDERIC